MDKIIKLIDDNVRLTIIASMIIYYYDLKEFLFIKMQDNNLISFYMGEDFSLNETLDNFMLGSETALMLKSPSLKINGLKITS